MKKFIVSMTLGILISALAVLAACSSSKKTYPDTSVGLQGSMRSMASSLDSLMPYVFSRDEFRDEANQKKINGLMEEFAARTAKVPDHVGETLLGKDPLVKYSLNRLRENSQQAIRAFAEGHKDYSRSTLRDSVSACFNCHSTTQFGPENNFDTSKLSQKFRMSTTEKADFYVATRQFDKAIDMLEGVLNSPVNFYEQPHEQVLALKKYLSLEVRVKKDPARAAKTLEKFLSQQKLPYFLASDAESWLKSLRKWSAQSKTVENPLALAKQLLREAHRAEAATGYQTGLIENLRASSLLHESLRAVKVDRDRAEVYHLLGSSYDSLSDLGLWDLPEVYFEACVRLVPKSPAAVRCYKSFERAIVLGFSGSAGVFIPTEERTRLSELRELSGLK